MRARPRLDEAAVIPSVRKAQNSFLWFGIPQGMLLYNIPVIRLPIMTSCFTPKRFEFPLTLHS